VSSVALAAGLQAGEASRRLELPAALLGALEQELAAIPAAAWGEAGARGDELDAVELVAGVGGGPVGPLAPTSPLEKADRLRALIASLAPVSGWTRLVRFAPDSENARLLSPIDLYGARRLAVVVPLRGSAGAFEPGGAWVLDPWIEHEVATGPDGLTALIVRCELSAELRAFLAAGELSVDPDSPPELRGERFNHAPILPPAELESVIADFREALPAGDPGSERLTGLLDDLGLGWRSIWSEHGGAQSAWGSYRKALADLDEQLAEIPADLRLAEGSSAAAAARRLFVRGAFNLERATGLRALAAGLRR
jgi:hypothetical protein